MTDEALDEGTYTMALRCPRCDGIEKVTIDLACVLTVPSDEAASLKVRAKSKAIEHHCDQLHLDLGT